MGHGACKAVGLRFGPPRLAPEGHNHCLGTSYGGLDMEATIGAIRGQRARHNSRSSFARSCRTTVLLPPRSAKWQRASTAARANPRFRKYGTAESAASSPRITFAAAFSLLASSTTARTFLLP